MTDYENNRPSDYSGFPNNNPSEIPDHNYHREPLPEMPPMGQEKKTKNRYASAALIFGVFSIINVCSMMFPMAIIMGVSAGCFAVLSKNKNEQDQKMTTAASFGLVMGIISAVLGVAEYFALLSVYDMMKDPELIPYFNDAFERLREYMQQT